MWPLLGDDNPFTTTFYKKKIKNNNFEFSLKSTRRQHNRISEGNGLINCFESVIGTTIFFMLHNQMSHRNDYL